MVTKFVQKKLMQDKFSQRFLLTHFWFYLHCVLSQEHPAQNTAHLILFTSSNVTKKKLEKCLRVSQPQTGAYRACIKLILKMRTGEKICRDKNKILKGNTQICFHFHFCSLSGRNMCPLNIKTMNQGHVSILQSRLLGRI